MLLSDKQLEQVEDMIIKSGLKNDQLRLDLTDHIACSLEDLIEKGQTFEQALATTSKVYNHGLIRNIEYNTNILTTETMQKHTKILGIIGLAIAGAGAILKMFHITGAYITMVVGVAILGIGFFGSNTLDMIRNLEGIKGKIVQIIGALGALATLAGGMFKLLHLPGALDLLMLGPFLLLLYFSFSTFLRTKLVEQD